MAPAWTYSLLISLLLYTMGSYTATATTISARPLPPSLKPGGVANFSIVSSPSTDPPSDRRYKVYIPPTYKTDTPSPLIICFHGRHMDPEFVEHVSQFSDGKRNPGYIVVYPEGTANASGVRWWQGDPEVPSSTNDTLFVTEVLDEIEATYCIDKTRIFATGISNGGSMVNRLAGHPVMSTRIAAFAIVAAAIYPAYDEPCRPGRLPIPMWEWHGGSDDQIFYHGGLNNQERGETIPVPEFMQDWAKINGCKDPAVNKTTKMYNGRGGYYGDKTSWDCDGHEDIVQHYYSQPAKHIWPWITNEAKFNATNVIMNFFKDHPLPAQENKDLYKPDLK